MCATLLPSAAERGRKDEVSGEKQANHEKQSDEQRVAVSEERERSRKSFKRGRDGSLH